MPQRFTPQRFTPLRLTLLLIVWMTSQIAAPNSVLALQNERFSNFLPDDTLRVTHLNQLLDAIPVFNIDLRAARLRTDALYLKRDQVSSWPDPMLGMTFLPSPIYTARGTQRWQLKAEQIIPFPGKNGLKRDIAELTAIIDSLSTDVAEDNLILQAKLAFFEIHKLNTLEMLIHEFQNKLRDFESIAAIQYEVGRGMQQAIIKAQLERNTLSTRLLDLSWQRQSAIATLMQLVNRPVLVEKLIGQESLRPEHPVLDEHFFLSAAMKYRPESIALDSSAVRASTSIDLADKMFYPDFSVGVTYFGITSSDIPMNADGKDALAIGFSVKVPLQRGRLNARREETHLNLARIQAERESLEIDFKSQIADLVGRIRSDEEQLELYEQALIPQSNSTLEATFSAYTTGSTDFLNLLDAERVRFRIHTGYEDIRSRHLKTIAMLERVIGVNSFADMTQE